MGAPRRKRPGGSFFVSKSVERNHRKSGDLNERRDGCAIVGHSRRRDIVYMYVA